MKSVGTRLGQDFDVLSSSYSEEGVLVDPYLANRFLRRKAAARETVDIDLTAARPCGRTGQCLQILGKVVRIVRQRIKIFFPEHQLRGVL